MSKKIMAWSKCKVLTGKAGSAYRECDMEADGALKVVASDAVDGEINVADVTPVVDGYTAEAGDYVVLDTIMATELFSVGTIKDKTTELTNDDGDDLEAIASGGIRVAKESQDGAFTLTTRIIEPSAELYARLGLSTDGAEGEDDVHTHIVDGDYSLKVIPKNNGAIGIKAPKTNISFKPGFSEEEGNYVDITWDILQTESGKWYTRYKSIKAPKTKA